MKYTLLFLFVFPLSAGAEIFAASGYLLELQRVEIGKKPHSLELLYSWMTSSIVPSSSEKAVPGSDLNVSRVS